MDKKSELLEDLKDLLGLYQSSFGIINSLLQSNGNINKNDKQLKSVKNNLGYTKEKLIGLTNCISETAWNKIVKKNCFSEVCKWEKFKRVQS
ncbi:MAG TPA: hypothetical protein QF753_18045 [Victivallales bacterium]|nr:hypothetical protein [Victivallales bacterium]